MTFIFNLLLLLKKNNTSDNKYRIINEAKHAIGMTIPFNPRK
jgi:hypothetical protein